MDPIALIFGIQTSFEKAVVRLSVFLSISANNSPPLIFLSRNFGTNIAQSSQTKIANGV
jgi:hypothetical protein